jgi:hypothetical protein
MKCLKPLWNYLFSHTCLKQTITENSIDLAHCSGRVSQYKRIYLFIIFSQVRSVMIDNIDKVLERGDRLELLVDKTANMQGNTVRFKRQARRFRNTVWWRNVKLTYGIF